MGAHLDDLGHDPCGRDRTRGTDHQSFRSVRCEHHGWHPERGVEEEYQTRIQRATASGHAAPTTDTKFGGNINAKDGRWGFNLSYNFNTGNNVTTEPYAPNRSLRSAKPSGTSIRTRKASPAVTMNGGRFGVDWQVSNRSTTQFLAIHSRAYVNDGDGCKQTSSTYSAPGGSCLGVVKQINTSSAIAHGPHLADHVPHKSPKEGKEWTMDFTYNNSRGRAVRRNRTCTATMHGWHPVCWASPRLQDNIGAAAIRHATPSRDFINPVKEKTKLEYGVKSNTRPDNTYSMCIRDLAHHRHRCTRHLA
jgi:hypothetical protein